MNSQNTSAANGPNFSQTNSPSYYPQNPSSSGNVTGSNSSNTTYAYYPDPNASNNNTNYNNYTGNVTNANLANNNTNYANTPPSHSFNIDQGVNALLECTAALGYNIAFGLVDYQNCLQLSQATLSDFAFDVLGQYIMSWADFAIDAALGAMGISSGRSYASPQQKSAQLTSVIASGYRWYD